MKQEQISIKNEPEIDHPVDDIHDIQSPPPSTAKSVEHSPSPDLQRRLDAMTKERNSLRQERDNLKKELSEKTDKDKSSSDGQPSVTQLSEQLEESWQKVEDLQGHLETLRTEKTNNDKTLKEKAEKLSAEKSALQQELKLLGQSNGDEALKESIAKLQSVTTERDLLREGKADLERRVNQFTKQLGEKLEGQARKIQDDFRVKLKDANEKAEKAETRAQDSIQEQAKLQDEIVRLNASLGQEDVKRKQAQERAAKNLKDCQDRVQGILKEQCKRVEDRERALKTRLEDAHKQASESQQFVKKLSSDLKQAKETQERTNKELADAKDKQDVAEKAVVEAKKQFEQQVKQDEALSKKRLEECRQELQVRV